MKYPEKLGVALALAVALIGCGAEQNDSLVVREGAPPTGGLEFPPDPAPGGPDNGTTAPTDATTFALVAPAAPQGTTAVTLTARLTSVTDSTISYRITSVSEDQLARGAGTGTDTGTGTGDGAGSGTRDRTPDDGTGTGTGDDTTDDGTGDDSTGDDSTNGGTGDDSIGDDATDGGRGADPIDGTDDTGTDARDDLGAITDTGTRIAPGDYELTFLDDQGNATLFTERVTVNERRQTLVRLGAVRISPQSRAFAEAVTVSTLNYRVGRARDTLVRFRGDIDRFVHLPPGQWEWYGQGSEGELFPLTLGVEAGRVLNLELGSIFVGNNYPLVVLEDAVGQVILPRMNFQTEYLLPATTQTEGCFVYTARFPQTLTPRRLQLCSDANPHVRL